MSRRDIKTIDPELLAYVEQAGLKNIEFHYQNTDSLLREANGFLLLVLSAAIAALGFGVSELDGYHFDWLSVGTILSSLYLFVIAALLVLKCLRAIEIPAPSNSPQNLLDQEAEWSLSSIREAELGNLDARIGQAVQRNDYVARWLNGLRVAATLTPVPFVLGALVGFFVGGLVVDTLCVPAQAVGSWA